MKHLTKIFLLGTIVLGAAACQRELVEGTDNPNYNAETREVVTSFVFNIAAQPQTKQNAASIQASGTGFRGLVDAKLLTYSNNATGILPADATADKGYDLSQLATNTQIGWDENRRVIELSLPLNTNTLLLYGRAPMGNAYDNYANVYDCYGHMDSYTVNKENGSAKFEAGHRLSNEEYGKFLHMENMIAGIQTTLLYHRLYEGTKINKDDAPEDGIAPYTFNAELKEGDGDILWEMYASADGKSPYATADDRFPLEDKLGDLYRQLTDIKTEAGELRAGSGEATMKTASDLLSVLNEIRCAIPFNAAEAVAKYFAAEVFDRVLKYFDATTNQNGGPITVNGFKSQQKIAEAYTSSQEMQFRPNIPSAISDAPEIYWLNATQLDAISGAKYAPKDFPFNFDLPRGAAHIAFDKTAHIFYYPQTFNVSGMEGLPGVGATYNGKSYYYPAELLYFGNSPIRTSSTDVVKDNYPQGSGVGTNQWCNDNSWAAATWNDTKVTASTRSVAMKYNINYGVGVLQTKVQFNGDNGYIYDNNKAVQIEHRGDEAANEKDNKIPIKKDMFVLTGIIIGGQPEAIGWDHLPVKINTGTTAEPVMQYKYGFIYDKAIPGGGIGVPSSGTSDPNYTLVYDNFHAASQSDAGIYTPEAHQDKVSVALEFRNDSGYELYGNHNLIRKGGYFYLIGLLDPEADGLAKITWPNDPGETGKYTTHVVPPYTAEGKSQKITRVFIQDFMTKATFTIGPNSLHYAYLTVPDLRSASMTLGLYVDLEWETGLSFENVLLGGN